MSHRPIIHSFARMLIGQDPLNIEAAWERIRTAGVFAGAQAGQYVTALTGVETALWPCTTRRTFLGLRRNAVSSSHSAGCRPASRLAFSASSA